MFSSISSRVALGCVVVGSAAIGIIIGEKVTVHRANKFIKREREEHNKCCQSHIDHGQLIADLYNNTIERLMVIANDPIDTPDDKLGKIYEAAISEYSFYTIVSQNTGDNR